MTVRPQDRFPAKAIRDGVFESAEYISNRLISNKHLTTDYQFDDDIRNQVFHQIHINILEELWDYVENV